MGCQSNRLLTLAGPALSSSSPRPDTFRALERVSNRLATELRELLESRNGFAAYLGALTVFASSADEALSIEVINGNAWRLAYPDLGADLFAFAADLHGGLFAIDRERICRLDLSTGQTSDFSNSIADWQAQIVADPAGTIRYRSALAWRQAGNRLEPGFGLVPTSGSCRPENAGAGHFEKRQIVDILQQSAASFIAGFRQ